MKWGYEITEWNEEIEIKIKLVKKRTNTSSNQISFWVEENNEWDYEIIERRLLD